MPFRVIVIAAAAGAAHASPYFSSNAGIAAAAPITSDPAGVAQFEFDLAGIEFFDGAGSPNNTIVEFNTLPNLLVGLVGWDITIQTNGGSWLSEANIGFLNSPAGLTLTPGVGDDFSGTATYSSNGLIDLASIDPSFPFSIGSDGILRLEFFESFDDVAGAADAVIVSGTLRINFPTPGPLAVLGAGLLAAARRRR